jgi:hypothetical protein
MSTLQHTSVILLQNKTSMLKIYVQKFKLGRIATGFIILTYWKKIAEKIA